MPYAEVSDNLKRAVIASEDASFIEHEGLDMEALEKAWEKNAKAEQRAAQSTSRWAPGKAAAKPAKIIGGSTITQQLAKNLFLSGERTLLRKGQELLLTLLLEALLDKQRILEIYLNSVEWGEGVFGAEAAAHHACLGRRVGRHAGQGRLAGRGRPASPQAPEPPPRDPPPARGFPPRRGGRRHRHPVLLRRAVLQHLQRLQELPAAPDGQQRALLPLLRGLPPRETVDGAAACCLSSRGLLGSSWA